ncbi:MAG TPA: hypothetical protein DCM28_00740 [Phycisphaerales bacterium]|nr:hypothetical protein [Phycisphaerales bacterium]HCD32335.1 hypothetical protein [Phycisphaerales bacterium]|tara:strand:- start:756 stop:1259 length:504 start_codon:yes stop_codon:yes gene_type:complete
MRIAHLPIVALCTVMALTITGCGEVTIVNSNQQQAAEVIAADTLAIQQQITGQSMALKLPNVFLINSEDQINATRSRQLKELTVDFNSQSIVLIALGEQKTGGYWVKINGIQPGDNGDVFVQATVNKPSKDQMTTQGMTYPFAAIITGKITGTVIPEIESVEGQPMP